MWGGVTSLRKAGGVGSPVNAFFPNLGAIRLLNLDRVVTHDRDDGAEWGPKPYKMKVDPTMKTTCMGARGCRMIIRFKHSIPARFITNLNRRILSSTGMPIGGMLSKFLLVHDRNDSDFQSFAWMNPRMQSTWCHCNARMQSKAYLEKKDHRNESTARIEVSGIFSRKKFLVLPLFSQSLSLCEKPKKSPFFIEFLYL
ncbi:hypothetical protein VNO77_15079 [Canavalia gladiata]|uniref:Uncharacterized protein n=1 Tax=Canavalia gladiata TaxID=3824 RepID=A0AAN9M3M4_CANGL